MIHSKPNVSLLRSSFDPASCATLWSSSSISLSAWLNSPAESGLKIAAPAPAGVSEHSVSSVTAAVESAKSRSPAGSWSFLRPKRMSPNRVRSGLGCFLGRLCRRLRARRARGRLGVAGRDLLLRRAGSDLDLELRELVVDLRGGGDLRELAVELRLVAGGKVLERASRRELVNGGGARLHLLGLVLG